MKILGESLQKQGKHVNTFDVKTISDGDCES